MPAIFRRFLLIFWALEYIIHVLGEFMFDIEELKNLSEMQAQTVHCLWLR